MRCLVLGGARSGKSGHGEQVINEWAPRQPVRYIATAPDRPGDEEWAERVRAHQQRRPAHWKTVRTDDLAAELDRDTSLPTMIDDLGMWLAAMMDQAGAWTDSSRASAPVDRLVDAVVRYPGPLVIVTPEVGMGIVPETRSGRAFRDEIGVLNARIAEECEKVVLVVAGIPLSLK
ncbi:bifunctional adenosylcobinamide kinase/adenosylcobinamide-phosphate guanylyltransferase [Hoyosella sp. G463]|uniref:Adenosylcobinamide kinase n=1 Tax=Lolliginicoccus lacisalsi TaxID=2742202 RepID=A0A927JF50_9ACTN|nr:bifunctional adenosylcobinamide kinase/adenosylcobinamide-phosphate guanylyltransferase [Lolliginicoccus lacisalsi]MBD8507707.1 bifunctional adenosylcobinamide kinase/adenosylcobinamide-phosphate guanylyltransferase [Lolliginicoccus lacisalsi]